MAPRANWAWPRVRPRGRTDLDQSPFPADGFCGRRSTVGGRDTLTADRPTSCPRAGPSCGGPRRRVRSPESRRRVSTHLGAHEERDDECEASEWSIRPGGGGDRHRGAGRVAPDRRWPDEGRRGPAAGAEWHRPDLHADARVVRVPQVRRGPAMDRPERHQGDDRARLGTVGRPDVPDLSGDRREEVPGLRDLGRRVHGLPAGEGPASADRRGHGEAAPVHTGPPTRSRRARLPRRRDRRSGPARAAGVSLGGDGQVHQGDLRRRAAE